MIFQKEKGEYRERIIMFCAFACIALTGLFPQKILSLIMLVCMCFLGLNKKLFLLYPIMIFYYAQLGLFFGISVYRIYTILFIILTITQFRKKLVLSKRFLAPFVIFLLYELFVMSQFSFKTAIFSMLDILCVVFLINFYFKSENNIKMFFLVYVKVALIAFFTGIIIKNNSITDWNYSGVIVEIKRFQATFDDPNYMGFFYTIAIFAIITLNLFNSKFRKIGIVILSCMILTTLSMTAILGNILLWGIYLLVTKKITFKTVSCIVVIFILAGSLYNYGLMHRDTPVIGDLSYRIESKINALNIHDYASVTTNRSELSKVHFEYFLDQGIFKQLFGGNLTNVYVIDLGTIKGAAHNDYIDSLLNIGIIGSIIMFGNILLRVAKSMKKYKIDKSSKYIFVFMSKCTLLYYLATITIFLDFRFMFAIFL